MAKGAESKAALFAKLQEIYPNAFWEDENKILRVPMTEDGNVVEIKVTLTAAKANLGSGLPESAFSNAAPAATKSATAETIEVTEEEKANVSKLLASLGL